MASTGSRRVVSRRSHEKAGSKADDPWCLVCDVNLALDGRTFTVVSSHQNSELCDVLLRVLAMTFTHEHAFVNVCNRCERQLKRLGRTTNIAMARQEGRKFRQQVEGNAAKHELQGVELGDFRNTFVAAPAMSSKSQNDGLSYTSGGLRRGETLEGTSSGRKGRELYNRSNSSVRVDEKDSTKRGAYSRDLSAPERKVQARDFHFPLNESSDRGKDVRRTTRSNVHVATTERAPSFRPISDETRSAVDRRAQSSIPSHQRGVPARNGKPSLQKHHSVDSAKTGKLITTRVAKDSSKLDIGQAHSERKSPPGNTENNTSKEDHGENHDAHNDSWELSSGELNPFTADIERENEHIDSADVVGVQSSGHIRARNWPVLADDDHFIQTERAVFTESLQSSHSSNKAVDNAEKLTADHQGNLLQTEQGEDAKTPASEDAKTPASEDDNLSSEEQLAANEENKERAKRLRVTFSENVGAEASDDPLSRAGDQSPQARPDNDKGKLEKYESIDLDIDSSNPFFLEVFGEYNRRVAVNRKVSNTGVCQASRRVLQKTEAIVESDEFGETHGSHVKETERNILRDEEQRNTCYVHQTERARTCGNLRGHSADPETTLEDDRLLQQDPPGDSQQESCPLIAEAEDNKEEQKDADDFSSEEPGVEQPVLGQQEVRDTARGEGEKWQEEEHGLIETERLEQEHVADVHETEDLVHLELTTSSSFLRHHQDSQPSPQTPWLYSVSKVIQVTHIQPPVPLDNVDLKEEGQDIFEDTDNPDGSKVSPNALMVDETSATKSEASPLIDKDEVKGDKSSLKGRDSKFKDQQPGLPCCTIL